MRSRPKSAFALLLVIMDLLIFSAGLLESRTAGINAVKITFRFGEQKADSQHVCYNAV